MFGEIPILDSILPAGAIICWYFSLSLPNISQLHRIIHSPSSILEDFDEYSE
jgi:hypothetical protein